MINTSEIFGLSWPGKAEAYEVAIQPCSGAITPAIDPSHLSDHIFIEGDNIDALKQLLPLYEGKVKLIYIDPPYNTGSDRFLYKDDFKGADSSGGHAAWLSMMLPRLILARKMLREDGVIFISIGDDEVHHLALLMNEIFGSDSFVANLLWRRRKTQANLSKLISPVHDYVLCYAKNKPNLSFNKVGYSEAFITKTFANPDNDPRGPYQTRPLAQPANSSNREHVLTMPNGKEIRAQWSCSPETFQRYIAEDRLFIPKKGNGMPRLKIFLSELDGAIPNTWLDDVGTNEEGSREIEHIFGSNAFFISPKPTALIKRLIRIGAGSKDDIILDFFAGSGTTAHAVAALNAEDSGTRKSISIQLPEQTAPTTLPYKQGYMTVADICRRRIERVLEEINNSRKEKALNIVSFQAYRIS